MKKLLLSYITFLIILLSQLSISAQQTLVENIMHDGEERSYLIYIPASYEEDSEMPLVFNFHGYGSSSQEQVVYGDFRSIADTAGFIVVHPQGATFNGSTHWNVEGWISNSPYDDVQFTSDLLDSLSEKYSINEDRIYSTGMSNGGFMSYLLACQLGDRIAAIASVTGSMTPQNYDDCTPNHPTPVLHIHGDDDSIVPYEGAFWTKSVTESYGYWVNYNEADPQASFSELEDINTNDGSTVEHYVHGNANNHAVVEHYKVIGGDHTWPGSIFNANGTNYDFNASEVIWQFFAKYDLNGIYVVNNKNITNEQAIQLYPNPNNGQFLLRNLHNNDATIKVYNIQGQLVYQQSNNSEKSYNLEGLNNGLYFLETEGQYVRFIIEK